MMNFKRLSLLLLLSGLSAKAMATLSAIANVAPSNAVTGQMVTVTLQITNSSANAVTSVSSQMAVSSGSASLLSGPTPLSLSLAPSARTKQTS